MWDHLDEAWRKILDPDHEVYPGLAILLPTAAGGYSEQLGWDCDSSSVVVSVAIESHERPEATGTDPNSCGRGPALTIADHTHNVVEYLAALLRDLGDSPIDSSDYLRRAARWHDVGKAHWAFQHGIRAANPKLDPTKAWAKSGTDTPLRHGRKYFRHELASALAALQHEFPFEVAYLIAAHHGKVRLSIRTLPDEDQPDSDTLFANGVHDGDPLGPVDLGGETCPATTLDLSPMQLGGEASWTARALAVRDALGPFRLAYLEALLRAADRRASADERTGDRP